MRCVEALWRRKPWLARCRAIGWLTLHLAERARRLSRRRRPDHGAGASPRAAPEEGEAAAPAPQPAERRRSCGRSWQCDRFMRATDAVVRRTQERTLAISTRLVADTDACCGSPGPCRDAVEDARVLSMKKWCRNCDEMRRVGALRLMRVPRALIAAQGLTVWSSFSQYSEI